jgi:uncharacterized protein (TIGR00369 family)
MKEDKLFQEVTISELVTPEMANFGGYLHGGELLKMADKAAYVCAHRYSREYTVTAAFDRVVFHTPVRVGDLITFFARIIGVGRTSMEVEIRVVAEDLTTGAVEKVSTCLATMVARRDGKAVEVPPLLCSTTKGNRDCLRAIRRREIASAYIREIDDLEKEIAGLSDDEVMLRMSNMK